MISKLLADAVADLVANPRPVLFLDTCDVVNILQVATTADIRELRAANRTITALTVNSSRCQLVATYVTAIEYKQKTDTNDPVYIKDRQTKRLPPDEILYQLNKIDAQIRKLHLAWQELGGPPLPAPTVYSNLPLLTNLLTTVGMLLDFCWELQRVTACVDAAVARVFSRTRPSQKREVKDSLHLEHCRNWRDGSGRRTSRNRWCSSAPTGTTTGRPLLGCNRMLNCKPTFRPSKWPTSTVSHALCSPRHLTAPHQIQGDGSPIALWQDVFVALLASSEAGFNR